MAAMGNRHVDILFLDIEGAEFSVLQSLPLEKVHIDSINIEVTMQDINHTKRKTELIESLLSQSGYHRLNTPFFIDLAMSKLKR